MGGTVAVTLRMPDGETFKMLRWTNMLPWAVNNMRFVKKDPKHLQDIMLQWQEMRKDYEKHKDDKQFEFNMTDCYFPCGGLVPAGYGLVVLDLQKDHILSCQGYSHFGHINGAGVSLAAAQRFSGRWSKEEEGDDVSRLQEAIAMNRVSVQRYNRKKKTMETLSAFKFPADFVSTWGDYDKMDKKHDVSDMDFILDMSPFKVEYYEETLEGFTSMRQKVLDLGFQLSQEENTLWDNFLSGLEE